MSLAEVVENTALFPPDQARLRLPRVPGTLLPSLPVMACGERPVASDILTSVTTADPVVASRSLTWYRRLHASYNKHRHLEPLRENDRLSSNERTAPGSSATGSRQTGTQTQVRCVSGNKSRSGKTFPRALSKEGANPKKENSDAARRRPKETLPITGKHHRSQRMSYPPCTKPSQTDEWSSLPTSEETNSCPVLCDLDNLTITPKKPSKKSTHTQPSTSEQASTKDATHQHKSKSDSTKRHREHDRMRVPDSTNTRSRHVKSRRPREDARSQRPKPPSWQDIPHDQPTANAAQEPVATHTYTIPESVHSIPAFRCDSATTRSTVDSDRRAVRANIRRTRSRVIDAKEIPKAETVLPLSQTKPYEFNLRKTYHDDTVYLLENTQRCRKWLAAVEEADVTPHLDESGTNGDSIKTLEDKEEIVTCDMEISHDKWNFLGSPYPDSSGSSSEDE